MKDSSLLFVVCDRSHGEKLGALAHEGHVWCVDSPANTAEAKALWAVPREHATTRVTTFDASPEETSLAMFERIFDTIAEHEVRATSLVLIGVPRSARLEEVLIDFGYRIVDQRDPHEEGSECIRASRMPAP